MGVALASFCSSDPFNTLWVNFLTPEFKHFKSSVNFEIAFKHKFQFQNQKLIFQDIIIQFIRAKFQDEMKCFSKMQKLVFKLRNNQGQKFIKCRF